MELNILRTSKHVYREAMPILYGQNVVRFRIWPDDWPLREDGVWTISPDALLHTKHILLELTFAWFTPEPKRPETLVNALADMPALKTITLKVTVYKGNERLYNTGQDWDGRWDEFISSQVRKLYTYTIRRPEEIEFATETRGGVEIGFQVDELKEIVRDLIPFKKKFLKAAAQ
jgi:hypothetical protein